MSNKTGWVTELDVIIDAESLSAEQKAYRQSQKVWLDPALETLRIANRKAGISYIVSAVYDYRLYCAEDVWSFATVRDRAYCSYKYFIDMLDAGLVWTSGDVSVYKEANKNATM